MGQSGTILDYQGLSGTIWDNLGLSGTISDYLGLSPEAIARPYNFETFCVTYTDTHTDIQVLYKHFRGHAYFAYLGGGSRIWKNLLI